MPVVQKIGPDGCLYILDWYDRYHCYQDASADPAGVDRGHVASIDWFMETGPRLASCKVHLRMNWWKPSGMRM